MNCPSLPRFLGSSNRRSTLTSPLARETEPPKTASTPGSKRREMSLVLQHEEYSNRYPSCFRSDSDYFKRLHTVSNTPRTAAGIVTSLGLGGGSLCFVVFAIRSLGFPTLSPMYAYPLAFSVPTVLTGGFFLCRYRGAMKHFNEALQEHQHFFNNAKTAIAEKRRESGSSEGPQVSLEDLRSSVKWQVLQQDSFLIACLAGTCVFGIGFAVGLGSEGP